MPSKHVKPRSIAALGSPTQLPAQLHSRARLDQVAALAGVSPATVSRVLNRPTLVASATQARVRAAVETLQFVPHPGARALARGRSYVIGALIPHIGYSIFAELMEALQTECHAAGYSVVMSVYYFDPAEELRQARHLVNSGVDAIMLVGFRHAPALFELLQAHKVHYVCTDMFDPTAPHPSVGYDNRVIGRQIGEFLIDLGHRRFAVVTGDTRRNDRMALRLTGLRQALRARGLSLTDSALAQGDYSLRAGRQGFARVFDVVQPTAVVCGNDVIAVGALLEARDRGIRVPQDVSIVGFDNLEWATEYSPSLTTVNVPCAAMGRAAAHALLARVEGRAAAQAIETPLALIVRESTTAPAVV